jgi:hypothetical protein
MLILSISYGLIGIFPREKVLVGTDFARSSYLCAVGSNAMKVQQIEGCAATANSAFVAGNRAEASNDEQPIETHFDLRVLRFMAFAIAILAILVAWSFAARAEPLDVTANRSAEQTVFTDAEITDGFFKIAFGAELDVTGNANRIRKFEKPVRVFVDDRAGSRRRAEIAAVVADIAAHVDHLDLKMTDDRKSANVVVTLVRDRDALRRTIRSFYGRVQAAQIERRLLPECLSGFGEDVTHRIERSEVILSVNSGDFRFLDCAYEEILQALGPINDDRTVPWTMFNDEVQMGYFDVYDQYLLNILYDPHVRPGMTKQQLTAVLPDVLNTARTWVDRTNPAVAPDIRADLNRPTTTPELIGYRPQ